MHFFLRLNACVDPQRWQLGYFPLHWLFEWRKYNQSVDLCGSEKVRCDSDPNQLRVVYKYINSEFQIHDSFGSTLDGNIQREAVNSINIVEYDCIKSGIKCVIKSVEFAHFAWEWNKRILVLFLFSLSSDKIMGRSWKWPLYLNGNQFQ